MLWKRTFKLKRGNRNFALLDTKAVKNLKHSEFTARVLWLTVYSMHHG